MHLNEDKILGIIDGAIVILAFFLMGALVLSLFGCADLQNRVMVLPPPAVLGNFSTTPNPTQP